jgi:hypothetical protein
MNKERPNWFSRPRCFETLHDPLVDRFIITFDKARGPFEAHFLSKKIKNEELILFDAGNEAQAFIFTLDLLMSSILADRIKPDDYIMIVEDDYMFKPNWAKFIIEGINLVGDQGFVAPYDHNDKYDYNIYPNLNAQLYAGNLCHWRTTPSTTNTYAGKAKVFQKFYELHKQFSQGVSVSRDHEKFIETWKSGGKLISPIPSIASHIETNYLAPCYNWNF